MPDIRAVSRGDQVAQTTSAASNMASHKGALAHGQPRQSRLLVVLVRQLVHDARAGERAGAAHRLGTVLPAARPPSSACSSGSILFVSLLVHEFSHILAVRLTGGVGNEILIWPLGGLALVQPAANFRSQFLTPAAGPLSNLAMCLLVAAPVWRSTELSRSCSIRLPSRSAGLARAVCLVRLRAHLLVQLDSASGEPDAGLSPRRNPHGAGGAQEPHGRRIGGRDGHPHQPLVRRPDHGWWACSSSTARGSVTFGAVAMILSLMEFFQMRTADTLDDSFMGYDFSQGYTSLERSNKSNPAGRAPPAGMARTLARAPPGRQGAASAARRGAGAAAARRDSGQGAL